MVKVVLAMELMVPSTPLPAVCISLSKNARNCFIPLATSRLVAFSTARSRPLVAYSTSFVISIAKRKKIGETCATSYAVPEPRPRSPPSALYEPALPQDSPARAGAYCGWKFFPRRRAAGSWLVKCRRARRAGALCRAPSRAATRRRSRSLVLASVVLLRIAAFHDAAASRRGIALASLEKAPKNVYVTGVQRYCSRCSGFSPPEHQIIECR